VLLFATQTFSQFWFVQNGDTIRSLSVTYNEYYKVDPYIEWIDKNNEIQKIDFPADNGITSFRESDENNIYNLLKDQELKEGKNIKFCKLILKGEITLFQFNPLNQDIDPLYYIKFNNNEEIVKVRYNSDVDKKVQSKLFECEEVRKIYDGKDIGILHLIESIKTYNYFRSKNFISDYIVFPDKGKKEFVSVEEGRLNGNVISLRTVDKNGNFEQIRGKEDCENIKTYCINNNIYDLIPLNPDKPNGYQRHLWRKIDGKIKFYDFYNVITKYDPSKINNQSSTTFIIKIAKLDNGNFIEVKKDKDIDEVLLPYLKKCNAFNSKYIHKERKTAFTSIQENYNNRLTENMIKLYNEVCN